MGIYKFNKYEGEVMDDVLKRFDKLIKCDKRCYTGRLDPLASGEIIILTDDDIFKKMIFCDFNKIYSFTLLHDFMTDTYDIMGIITQQNVNINKISTGKYLMEYPPYSSYNIKGKPYWHYTKNNLIPPFIPKKEIDIFLFETIGNIEITGENLIKIITQKINKVDTKTFRQNEIINKWKENIIKENVYYATKFIIGLSSGGFVRYFGNKMNGTCYDIKRLCYCYD